MTEAIQIANYIKEISSIDPFENTRKRKNIEIRSLLTFMLRHHCGMKFKEIKDFYKTHNTKKNLNVIPNLTFKKPDQKIFPIIKIIKRINEYPSTPIIINSANEVLVEQFLQKNLSFLGITKIIMSIMNDRNYRKYAIKTPSSINQIKLIDRWAREITYKKLNYINENTI